MRKISGFPFPSGFRDFEKKNQTEPSVIRKKSGFRTARKLGMMKFREYEN